MKNADTKPAVQKSRSGAMRVLLAGIVALATAVAAEAGNLILVGDSTLAPRKPEQRIGSWGDTMKNDKKVFDTCHPSKAGAKCFGEAFIKDATDRKLKIASIFK